MPIALDWTVERGPQVRSRCTHGRLEEGRSRTMGIVSEVFYFLAAAIWALITGVAFVAILFFIAKPNGRNRRSGITK